MRNRGIFGFAGAMRHDAAEAVVLGEQDGINSLSERANLVWFNENSVGGFLIDASLKQLSVSDEEIIADDLDMVAEAVGKHRPAIPVVFTKAILDGDNRIVFGNPLVPVGEVVAGLTVAVSL